jgi:hypothetical protein
MPIFSSSVQQRSEQHHKGIYASVVIVWSATLVLSSFFSMSGRLVIIPLSVLMFYIINASFIRYQKVDMG